MRATGPIHALKPSAGRLAGDVHRAFVASGLVVGVCVGTAVFASWAHSSMSRGAQSHAVNGANLSTGSLLIVSPSGTFCRNRTIDNSTWQIRDNGWVDCEDALAKSASGTDNRGSRLDLIRQSFRGNP
ncbi:MAG TPA: hypothetical protein VIY51_03890 [Xanthobacteraceae bacterium]